MSLHAPKKRRNVTLETELPGVNIKVLPSHRLAEAVAKIREQYDDLSTKIDLRKMELQKQMKADGLTSLSARGPGGSFYFFDLEQGVEKLKISKPAAA